MWCRFWVVLFSARSSNHALLCFPSIAVMFIGSILRGAYSWFAPATVRVPTSMLLVECVQVKSPGHLSSKGPATASVTLPAVQIGTNGPSVVTIDYDPLGNGLASEVCFAWSLCVFLCIVCIDTEQLTQLVRGCMCVQLLHCWPCT